MTEKDILRKVKNKSIKCNLIMTEKEIEQLKKSLGLDEMQTEYEIITSALDKQIPKKPNEVVEEKTGIKFAGQEVPIKKHYCCSCNTRNFIFENFCPNCGQKLDWSEE